VELADAETVTRSVNELNELLNNSQFAEKKSFVRTFVKEVKVTDNEVLITGTIPMLPNGNDEDKLSVLSFGHDGGQDIMSTHDNEQKCPACGQDIMSLTLSNGNKENCPSCGQDIMFSIISEKSKQKCPSCGRDIMSSPIIEKNKQKCPSCGQDIMSSNAA
jgi:predicted RNA-binding Zn-ribbon protein involved in translation (DUF1610 family)